MVAVRVGKPKQVDAAGQVLDFQGVFADGKQRYGFQQLLALQVPDCRRQGVVLRRSLVLHVHYLRSGVRIDQKLLVG